NKPVELRSLMQGKKLVMVLYFAPWCPNWRNEAPVAAGLYEKYKSQGFEIVAVGEYGSRDDVRAYFGPPGPPYPVVTESESREDREKTSHFGYRQLTGDTRKWGSPWNIFLDPAKCNSNGDVLVNRNAVKPSFKIHDGDEIEVELTAAPAATFFPEDIPLEILYEDEDLVVVNKPAGMVVHPAAGVESGTLANALAFHFQRL